MRHPRLANAIWLFFFLWPFVLIAFKARFPAQPWSRLWLTVPLVSWVTVNAAIRLDYPTQGAGGGMGMGVNLVVGWFYMLPLFGIVQLAFLFFQYVKRRLTKTA